MKILAISDTVVDGLYSAGASGRCAEAELIISCGDLPYYYPEYLISILNIPLFYVRGNHDVGAESFQKAHPGPLGGFDLHRRIHVENGVILAGVEGSLRYRDGPFMYSQSEMWFNVFGLIPYLLINRIRYGRYVDIFVSHAPPFGVNDREDYPHKGVKAFHWFDRVFLPKYHLHGHIHLYQHQNSRVSKIGNTSVINCYGYQIIDYP